jgi:hypothetical protein
MRSHHICPRCKCSGLTTDSFRRTACILCGWREPTATGTNDPDNYDPEALVSLYAKSQLILRSRHGGNRLVTII